MNPHRFPEVLARSAVFHITADGLPLDVLEHSAADYSSFECEGSVRIEVALPSAPGKVVIRPLRHDIQAEIEGRRLRFTLAGPQYIQIEIEGLPLLYLYALPPAPEAPSGPNVKRFEGGKIHDAGEIILGSGDVCWIEAGAVVRGNVRAVAASGIRIGGYGVLDGGIWQERGETRRKAISFDACTDSRVENILMLSPSSWMVVLGGCSDVEVSGVRQIADNYGSDGVDIVGSRRIRITGCMLHNGDDNIAVKAIYRNPTGQGVTVLAPGQAHGDWNSTVEDVLVSGCAFYCINGGSAMEIGYETSTDHIRNIRFEDIDVLGVHSFGSVFGIHTGDRALVENITWDNIRVEHHYDKLVDLRVVWSRWNRDSEHGSVRSIGFRNIRVAQIPPNIGYTLSVIAGFDAAHPVSDVLFEDFELGGRQVANADQLDLVTRHAHQILFR